MAKNDKKKDSGVSKLDSIPISSVIGNDIQFKGDIHGESVIRIDGRVEGNIHSKKGIILGESAYVEGYMESDNIIIFGHLKGTVKSKELILKSTGSVQGDIVTDSLEVEMGSKYDGNLKINKIESSDEKVVARQGIEP